MPIIGPSIVPMPPMTTMKITKTVQSFIENAASGEMRSLVMKIRLPIIVVTPAAAT